SHGKGHDTLAEACADALAPYGVESKVLDCGPLMGRGPGVIADRVFRALLSSTPVYAASHSSQLRGEGVLGRFADRASERAMYPHLRDEARRFRPDLIVSVFATGTAAAERLKEEHPGLVTVVFMTDSFAHRVWVHEGTDLFLVTSDLAAASVRRYWPQARVDVVNAPVRSAFYEAPTQDAARAGLGVPGDASCVLVVSGSWGVGPLAEVAAALARAGHWVLAVAGTNGRLERR